MKLCTKNSIRFALSLLIATALFRYLLSSLLLGPTIDSQSIALLAIVYGIMAFIFGWYFGKKDFESLPLYDVGFRFHLLTYLVCNGYAYFWFLSGLTATNEDIAIVHYTAIFWGIGLLVHSFFYLQSRKEVIDGMHKGEIFE